MAIYDLGTASLSANGEVTGVGTTWKAPLTLIRVGATIVFKTEPVQIYTISEIISDTQINVYNPNSETVPAGTGYAILAHDGITVQGLAQDVAETLRYYQSSETQVAEAVDAFKNFDTADFYSKVTQVNNQLGEVVSISAQVSTDAAQVSTDKDAAASSASSASSYKDAAASSASSASSYKDAAAASAQQAADYANSVNPSSFLKKEENLNDLQNKPQARSNLGLGTSATIDHGDDAGKVQLVYGARLLSANRPTRTWSYGYEPYGNGFNLHKDSVVFMDMPGPTTLEWGQLAVSYGLRKCYIANSTYDGGVAIMELYHKLNTTVDSSGFIKVASPIIKVFRDGSFETNEESEGASVERISTGVYKVSGVLGLNSDTSWGGVNGGFDIPSDLNKQPRIWLDYEVEADGSIVVKTYHRTHDSSPSFARNKIDGFSNGDPIDIPSDSFVSIRVNMP